MGALSETPTLMENLVIAIRRKYSIATLIATLRVAHIGTQRRRPGQDDEARTRNSAKLARAGGDWV